MTKRRDLLSTIRQAAQAQGLEWVEIREGARHTVYALDGLRIPVPRHRDIDEQMARVIYRECEPKLGKDWWR
jgi:hypothetical protein